ncbi:MAG: hypothetical protein BIFFINMI_02109 [Phycisphaerae bacterium]|nr:hypothetical protein [Phycisphaerae bacterium]
MFDLQLSDSEKAQFLEAARLCGYWLVNSQNTPERPWGNYNVADSIDAGRFIEKCCPSRNYVKPVGVWLTGLYLAGLADLMAAPVLDRQLYARAVELGSKYLLALQCFDSRWPRGIGGFHELYPGHSYSAPRDAATGAMGLIALHLLTGEKSHLDRAVRFGQWYSTFGSDDEGYPWDDFDLAAGLGTTSNVRGDWQAGGGLVYYQLHRLTGDARWADALGKVLDSLERIVAAAPGADTPYDFHGNCVLSIGNDDFANTALLAGHQLLGRRRYLDLATERLRAELARQDDRGAFPGYGGTFVTALELLEALDLADAGVVVVPPEEIVGPLLRAARFGLTLQERTNENRYMLGGVYGQSNYAHARDVVHGRDTAYALQLWLRLSGRRASTYTTLGWGPK